MGATELRRKSGAIVATLLFAAATTGLFVSSTIDGAFDSKKTAVRSDLAKAESLCEKGKWEKAFRLADSVAVAIRANEYDEQGTQAQVKEFQEYLTRANRIMETCASRFRRDASNVDEDETLIFEF